MPRSPVVPSQSLALLRRGPEAHESWDDKQSGEKKYRDFVYADKIEFLDSKGNGNGGTTSRGEAQQSGACDPPLITDEDIPF